METQAYFSQPVVTYQETLIMDNIPSNTFFDAKECDRVLLAALEDVQDALSGKLSLNGCLPDKDFMSHPGKVLLYRTAAQAMLEKMNTLHWLGQQDMTPNITEQGLRLKAREAIQSVSEHMKERFLATAEFVQCVFEEGQPLSQKAEEAYMGPTRAVYGETWARLHKLEEECDALRAENEALKAGRKRKREEGTDSDLEEEQVFPEGLRLESTLNFNEDYGVDWARLRAIENVFRSVSEGLSLSILKKTFEKDLTDKHWSHSDGLSCVRSYPQIVKGVVSRVKNIEVIGFENARLEKKVLSEKEIEANGKRVVEELIHEKDINKTTSGAYLAYYLKKHTERQAILVEVYKKGYKEGLAKYGFGELPPVPPIKFVPENFRIE